MTYLDQSTFLRLLWRSNLFPSWIRTLTNNQLCLEDSSMPSHKFISQLSTQLLFYWVELSSRRICIAMHNKKDIINICNSYLNKCLTQCILVTLLNNNKFIFPWPLLHLTNFTFIRNEFFLCFLYEKEIWIMTEMDCYLHATKTTWEFIPPLSLREYYLGIRRGLI